MRRSPEDDHPTAETDPPLPQARTRAVLRVGLAVLALAVTWALLPLTSDPATPIKTLILHGGVALLAVLWAGASAVTGARGRMPRLLGPVFALFVVWGMVTALASGSVVPGLLAWRSWAVLFAVYAVAAFAVRMPRQAWRLLAWLGVAASVSAGYGLCQWLGLDPFPWEDRTATEYLGLPSTFGNPNFAAHVLVLALIVLVGLSTRRSTRWAAVLLVPCAVHFYLTGIRAGWLALGAAAAVLITARIVQRGVRRPVMAAGLTLAVVGVLGLAAAGAALAVNQARTGRLLPLDSSILLRYNSFYGASRMILDRPVLGVGPGNYLYENPAYWTPYEQEWFARERRLNNHVHNDVLEAGVESGLLGAGLYLALLTLAAGYSLVLARRGGSPDRRRLGWVLAAAFTAFAVDGLFGFNSRLPASALYFALLAGMLEGVWGGVPAPPPRAGAARRYGLAFATAVAALALVALEVRVFQSRLALHHGRAARQLGAFDAAEAALKRGEALAPWHYLFGWELGGLYRERDRHDEALAAYQRSLDRFPLYVVSLTGAAYTHVNRAVALQSAGAPESRIAADLDAATSLANEALAICPPFASGHDILGRATSIRAIRAQAAGMTPAEASPLWEEAAAHFEQALQLGADRPGEINLNLAQAYVALGKTDAAAAALRRAVQASPEADASWQFFEAFAAEYGRQDALLAALEEALARLRRTENVVAQPALLLRLGRAREAAGDTEGAAQAFQQAVEADALRLEAWHAWATLARQTESLDQVWTALRTAQDGAADLPPPLAEAAQLAQGTTDVAELAERVAAWTAQFAQSASSEAVAERVGWIARLIADRAAAAALEPGDQGRVYRSLGVIYTLAANWDPAAAAFNEAAARLEGDDRIACILGHAQALNQLGRGDDALVRLRAARSEAPGDPNVHLALARQLAANGAHTQARFEYTVLLRTPGLPPDAAAMIQRELDALPR